MLEPLRIVTSKGAKFIPLLVPGCPVEKRSAGYARFNSRLPFKPLRIR